MVSNKELNSILINAVRKKNQFAGISESIISKNISDYFSKNKKVLIELLNREFSQLQRSSLFKESVKAVRAHLHKHYGAFQAKKSSDKTKILSELKILKDKKNESLHKKLLTTNLSARERLMNYSEVYSKIFEITGKPKSVLDLGAGLNPISFPFMNLEKVEYTATEINEDDLSFLTNYFSLMNSEGLEGKAICADLSEEDAINNLKELSKVDITLIFKLLESISSTKKKKYQLAESIIKSLKSKWIVVSFATKTLSQKGMKNKRRLWFELMLNRLKLKFEKLEFENEIFYIIKNNL